MYNKIEPSEGSNSLNDDLSHKVTTLRLPIFCAENKPYIFIKVMNHSEKYRISVNSDFLKKYNLNFKILRDQSLINFMNGLKPSHRNILKKGVAGVEVSDSDRISNTSIFLRLPEKEKFPILKNTILLENDGESGRTLIDKYQIVFDEKNKYNTSKKNIIYIIERSYKSTRNVSIAFISEEYQNINEFLEAYAEKINL